jgi:nickel transport system substrate-binding protein
VQHVVLKILPSLEAVSQAVADGSVDLVYGSDTVNPKWFKELHGVDTDALLTFISPPLSTRVIMLNSARAPLSSLAVRKAIMHAVDKQVRGGAGGQASAAALAGWCAARVAATCLRT